MTKLFDHFEIALLFLYFGVWIGHAISSVGDSYAGGTYTWDLVIGLVFIMGVPALFGYLIGSKSDD